MIPLSIPYIFNNEKKYVNECLETGWISSSGNFVNRFENVIADYVGSKHAVACMNGTVGLQISLILSGVNKDDIVIAPNLTFVATINAISYTGATPILFDINQKTWQIDAELIQDWLHDSTLITTKNGKKVTIHKSTGKRISAIIPVHVLGSVCDIEKISSICKKYNIKIIEDSTESLGSHYKKKHTGTFGEFGVFSFNGNKIISTGGGGMIITNNTELAMKAKHITTTAKTDPLHYYHDEIGYNYRLVNILAAIGVGQMENFTEILEKKKHITSIYKSELKEIEHIKFQQSLKNSDDNCWLFTFRSTQNKGLLNHLNSKNIQSRPFWTPMNRLPMYKNLNYVTKNDYSYAVFKECLSIPSSSNLSASDQEIVIQEIKKFYK